MKKAIAHVILLVLCAALVLSGCTPATNPPADVPAPTDAGTPAEVPQVEQPAAPVELTVVTSYGGEDGNRANYEDAVKAWEDESGNKVLDNSGTSNEEWKAKVNTDFEAGTEPDVLFFFTGADADSIINAGKVVSLDTIRAEYPEYGTNMVEDSLPLATDGVKYALPTTGYWEGLFTNVKLLKELNIAIPDANYTWEQFLADCQTIKDAGKTPIACSLQEVPHYWFEFVVMNNGKVSNHLALPASAEDEAGLKWVNGLADIKELYEKGFISENTLTAPDSETFQAMFDGDAAFAIDGSWKIGAFEENAPDHLEDYQVLYVPGKGDRKASDVIGGLSMGYYITKKAWEDPAKRAAAVNFVQHMTSDEVVNKFAETGVAATALKNPKLDASSAKTSLHASAMNMLSGLTGVAPAVQDTIKAGKADLFGNVKNVVSGSLSEADALTSAIALFNQDAQ